MQRSLPKFWFIKTQICFVFLNSCKYFIFPWTKKSLVRRYVNKYKDYQTKVVLQSNGCCVLGAKLQFMSRKLIKKFLSKKNNITCLTFKKSAQINVKFGKKLTTTKKFNICVQLCVLLYFVLFDKQASSTITIGPFVHNREL